MIVTIYSLAIGYSGATANAKTDYNGTVCTNIQQIGRTERFGKGQAPVMPRPLTGIEQIARELLKQYREHKRHLVDRTTTPAPPLELYLQRASML